MTLDDLLGALPHLIAAVPFSVGLVLSSIGSRLVGCCTVDMSRFQELVLQTGKYNGIYSIT